MIKLTTIYLTNGGTTLTREDKKDKTVGEADGKDKTGREVMMEDIGKVVELKVAPLAQELRKIKTTLAKLSSKATESEAIPPPAEMPPADEPVEAEVPAPDPVQPRTPEEQPAQAEPKDEPKAEPKAKPKAEEEDDPWSEFDLTK